MFAKYLTGANASRVIIDGAVSDRRWAYRTFGVSQDGGRVIAFLPKMSSL